MTNNPGHPAMTAECLSAFWGTRRTVRVTLTLKGPDNASRVTVADMPGLLADAIVQAILARPLAAAAPSVGSGQGRDTREACLALYAPASRLLGATAVSMSADFDGTPECVAYARALTASHGAPVRSAAVALPDMLNGAVWASVPREVVTTPMPYAAVRRARYAALVAADPGVRTRRSADRKRRFQAARAASL